MTSSAKESARRWWRRPGVLAVGLLPLHAAALTALAGAPDLVERAYGRLVFPRVAALHAWLDQTPLSPSVTLGCGLLALLCAWTVRASRTGRRAALGGACWRALVAAAVLAHLFPVSWG